MSIFKKLSAFILGTVLGLNLCGGTLSIFAKAARSVEYVTMTGEPVYEENVSCAFTDFFIALTTTTAPYTTQPHRENENGEEIFSAEIEIINDTGEIPENGIKVVFSEYSDLDTSTFEPVGFVKEIYATTTTGGIVKTPDFVINRSSYYVMDVYTPDGWRIKYNGTSSYSRYLKGEALEFSGGRVFRCYVENKPTFPVWEYPVSGSVELSIQFIDYLSEMQYYMGKIASYDDVERIKGIKAEVYKAERDVETNMLGELMDTWDTTETPIYRFNADYDFVDPTDRIYYAVKILDYPEDYKNEIAYRFGDDGIYYFSFSAEGIRQEGTDYAMCLKRDKDQYVTTMTTTYQRTTTLPTETTVSTTQTTSDITTSTETSTATDETVIIIGNGDANCDNKLSIADSVFIMQCSALPGKYKMTEKGRENADVIGNDGVTNADALEIQRFILGLTDVLGSRKR